MIGKDIIKAIMETKGVSNATLANRLSITQQALWDRLNNKKATKDLSTAVLVDMAAALDYKVVVVPRETRIKEGYVIE